MHKADFEIYIWNNYNCNYYHFYDLKLKKNIYVVEGLENYKKFYEDNLPEYILKDE